jgi:hypothetical protein
LQFLIDHKLSLDSDTEKLIKEARVAFESGNWAAYECKVHEENAEDSEDEE